MLESASTPLRQIGRYALFGEIASGGMATVRFGRLLGEAGFSRTVAVKCLHESYANDEEFANMFLDEARLAARIRHPNVVPTLDVVTHDGQLYLIMEYIQGETLARLLSTAKRRKERIPVRVGAAVMADALDGLHAAHEARTELGVPLGIVHRDVSPQNIMVGVDGVARVLDFGVAKAIGRLQTTRKGQLKGKLPYMSPEQLHARQVDRRVDVYAASVVLWEVLAGRRLFKAPDEAGVFGLILRGEVPAPSAVVPSLPRGYDTVTLKGLSLDPDHRFETAREMAVALEQIAGVASPREVGAWVQSLAEEALREKANALAHLESISSIHSIPPAPATVSTSIAVRADTTASTSAVVSPSNSRVSWLLAGAVLLVVLLLSVSLGLVWGGRMNRTGLVDGSGGVPSLSVPGSSLAPPSSSNLVPSPPVVDSAPASVTSSRPRPEVRPGPRGKTPPSPTPDCSPPYVIDDRGVRVPKPHCL